MAHIVLPLMFWLASAFQTPVASPAPAFEGHADLPGVRLWYRDSGGAGVPVVFMHAATGQQSRLGLPDSGVRCGGLPRHRVRPARVRPHGPGARRRAAGHRGRRSPRADEPSERRSLPSGRHRGRRLRVGGLRAVVSAAAAQPGDRQQHRRRPGRGLPGAGTSNQAAGVQRPAGGPARAGPLISCGQPGGHEALAGARAHEPRGRGAAGADDAQPDHVRVARDADASRRCC